MFVDLIQLFFKYITTCESNIDQAKTMTHTLYKVIQPKLLMSKPQKLSEHKVRLTQEEGGSFDKNNFTFK